MAILGVDVSQETLDMTLIDAQEDKHQRQFCNHKRGLQALKRWIGKHEVQSLHVCLEATNVYWEACAEFAYQQDWAVSVVNPARIKGFAKSQMRRNKTDPEDSDIIADFCACLQPRLWHPPTPVQRQLRAWVRHRLALQKTRTQQTNRLHTCKDAHVRTSLQTIITLLDAEIAHVEADIEGLLQEHDDLRQQYEYLVSVKGIGHETAVFLLAEMYDLAEYENARAAAADAGVTPCHHQSGTSVKRRPQLSKVGKASVRAALYWPAITAIQHNPLVKALAERLRARGKPKKVIIGAAMRKLLHIAYGVLKNQTFFDPHYAH
jgi:transposase